MGAYESEREELLKGFGRTLRELREAKFSSLEAFALAANLNRVHIHYWEAGERSPELATLLVLAATLDVSLDRLAEGLEAPVHRRPPPHGEARLA
jgi:transcriptional regulator with XRE-family HTH domain